MTMTMTSTMIMLIYMLIAMAIVVSNQSNTHVQCISIVSSSKSHIFASLAVAKPQKRVNDLVKEVTGMIPRLPAAVSSTLVTSGLAFIQTAAFLIPIGLLMKIGMIKDVKGWLLEGSKMGMEWGAFSALFTGGEELCLKLRNKNDRWNSYIASGFCSGYMKMPEGYLGVAQGFVSGVAVMYTIDQLFQYTQNSAPRNSLNPLSASNSRNKSRLSIF